MANFFNKLAVNIISNMIINRVFTYLFILIGSVSFSFSQIIPSDLSSLLLWYDANDLTISPGNVTLWKDKSGNDYDLLQPTASNQPIKISNALGDKSIIRFDGGDFMTSAFGSNYNNPGTIFILYKTVSSANQYLFDGLTSFNSMSLRNGNTVQAYIDGSLISYNKTYPSGFTINALVINISNSMLKENGVIKTTGNLTSNSFEGINLGRYYGGGGGFYGDIAEFIYYNRALTTSEIEDVESYLRHKYAPPVNLGPNISRYGFCDTTLYAGKRFDSYLWSNGSTADSLIVSEPGTYWVETVDIFGNTSSDTIEVVFGTQHPTSQLYCPSEFIDWQTGLGEHYNYLWSDGSTADSLVINSPGSYHVTVTDTNGCIFKSDTLSFSEDPFTTSASLGPDKNLCAGNNLELSVGANEAMSYLWNTGETLPEIEITTSGSYHVEVQNANGCIAQDTIAITIIGDAPIVSMNIPSAVCTAAPFNFEDISSTTDGSNLISWNWDFGEGSSASTDQGSFAYATDGNYNVVLTIETSSGCFNTLTAPIEVKANPIMTFTSTNICQNQSIDFNGGQMSPQTITDWNWNFNDPASGAANTENGQNPSHTFDTAGDFDVRLVGTDVFGCIDTLIQTINIAPTPVAGFTFTEVCEGSVVNYINASTVGSPAVISSYQWTFGDGTNSSQTNPQKPYASQGSYTVGLTAIANNGCSDSESQTVKIHAIPQVNYTLEQACAGIETQFIDNSFIPNGSVAQVDWTINGQTTLTGFTVTNNFSNSGSYNLEQTVQSAFGCMNSASSTISIKDFIEAGFVFSPNAFVTGYPIVFESTSTGANQYNWTFGDFATSQQTDTSIVFAENQIGESYEVELWVRNIHGCTDSISIQRTVMERHTDLEISQLFSQEANGYLTLGVQLKNLGTTPITKVDLFLRKPAMGAIKESWTGNLQAGQTEIYIFSASPSATVPAADTAQNYICIEGRIVAPAQFVETDLSNNEVCKVIAPTEAVLIRPYPNPVTDQLTIKVVMPKKAVLALHVYDDQGRLVHTITDKEELSKGLNTFHVNTSSWAAGNYKIRTVGSEGLVGNVPSVGFVKI